MEVKTNEISDTWNMHLTCKYYIKWKKLCSIFPALSNCSYKVRSISNISKYIFKVYILSTYAYKTEGNGKERANKGMERFSGFPQLQGRGIELMRNHLVYRICCFGWYICTAKLFIKNCSVKSINIYIAVYA